MRRILATFLIWPWWRLSRGLTLGVRAVVADEGKILLVRHSYAPGWFLPGGGVERGETVAKALERELREEGNIVLDSAPNLHGIYSNDRAHRGDHVVLFVADKWRQEGKPRPNAEILEAEFFSIQDLPDGTTPATRRRIAEVFAGAPTDTHW